MDNMKHNNIHIMGIREGEEHEQLFEDIMTENFPNLVKKKDTQVQKLREYQTSWTQRELYQDCLLYTSDAADDSIRV